MAKRSTIINRDVVHPTWWIYRSLFRKPVRSVPLAAGLDHKSAGRGGGGGGGRGSLPEHHKPVLVETIPYRVLVGSSIKRIDVHTCYLAKSATEKTAGGRGGPAQEEFPSRSIVISGARVSRAFGKYQTGTREYAPSFYARSARPIFDIQYPERTYHPRLPPRLAVFRSPPLPPPSSRAKI